MKKSICIFSQNSPRISFLNIISYLKKCYNTSKLFTFISNDDSLDWKDNATPDSICKRVTSKVKNGSIVLFHNDADHTPEALPNILKCLKD